MNGWMVIIIVIIVIALVVFVAKSNVSTDYRIACNKPNPPYQAKTPIAPRDTQPSDLKPQEEVVTRYKAADAGPLGSVSIMQQSSKVLSNMGARRPEPLEARYAFMRGVLSDTKQSRYMVPIAE